MAGSRAAGRPSRSRVATASMDRPVLPASAFRFRDEDGLSWVARCRGWPWARSRRSGVPQHPRNELTQYCSKSVWILQPGEVSSSWNDNQLCTGKCLQERVDGERRSGVLVAATRSTETSSVEHRTVMSSVMNALTSAFSARVDVPSDAEAAIEHPLEPMVKLGTFKTGASKLYIKRTSTCLSCASWSSSRCASHAMPIESPGSCGLSRRLRLIAYRLGLRIDGDSPGVRRVRRRPVSLVCRIV